MWAELLLGEFRSDLDVHLPPDAFSIREQLGGSLFREGYACQLLCLR